MELPTSLRSYCKGASNYTTCQCAKSPVNCKNCQEHLNSPCELSLEDLLHPPIVSSYSPPINSSIAVGSSHKTIISPKKEQNFQEICARNFCLILWDSLSSKMLEIARKMHKKNKASTAVIITGLLAKLGKKMGKPLYKTLKKKFAKSGTFKLGLSLVILVIGVHKFCKTN